MELRAKLSRARNLLARLSPSARAAKRERNRFYREMWGIAAEAIGAETKVVGGDLIRVARGSQATFVFRNYTDLDGPATLRACGNKALVHELLNEQRIPTPEHRKFDLQHLGVAARFLSVHGACVIKPVADTGAGQGVTTGIETFPQLKRAAIDAASFGSELLIERQIAGHNVRMLFLDGEMLDAVQRCPPTITADGKSTIGALVKRENQRRITGGYDIAQVALRRDADMRTTLAGQQLTWRSIPMAGQRVMLKTVINDNAADENVSVVDQLSPVTVEIGRRAAATLGVRLAGVDILIEDLAADLPEAGVVLEVNTTPGLYIHQASGSADVAIPILETCLLSSGRDSERLSVASRMEATQ